MSIKFLCVTLPHMSILSRLLRRDDGALGYRRLLLVRQAQARRRAIHQMDGGRGVLAYDAQSRVDPPVGEQRV